MKKIISLILAMLMMLTFLASCGGEATGDSGDGGNEAETESEEDLLEEAQKKFDAGEYTSYSYVNDWLGIKYYPLPGMIADPELDEKLNATYDIEADGITLMHFRADYLSVSKTDKRDDYVMISIKKLDKEMTSDECLDDVLANLSASFNKTNETYAGMMELDFKPLIDADRTIGGAEYSGKLSSLVTNNLVSGEITTTVGGNYVRYIDGYSISIQVQGCMYTVDQLLDRFEFMNEPLTGADSFGISASDIKSRITTVTGENLSMSSEVKCSGTSTSLYYGRYISDGMEYCIRETAGKADMLCVSMTKNYDSVNVETLKKEITEMCRYMVLPEFDTVASITKATAFSSNLTKNLVVNEDGKSATSVFERNGYTYSFVYVDTVDCHLFMMTVTKAG